ncbi:acyl-CoA carboxylase subunit epsilon [Streptomyces polygonati]|uniref:Acyl-CoA carboxylase subunit epsilon n=1 Tax=Streptomyces polygonati TaxID=1617087 RepID=A0ABV8HD27_9ACTN
MSEVRVQHGNPSSEQLAAVLAVLMALGQGAPETAPTAGSARLRAGWDRSRFGGHSPAGSWRSAR